MSIKGYKQTEEHKIKNGRTLCVPCHKKTNSYLKNIKKQI